MRSIFLHPRTANENASKVLHSAKTESVKVHSCWVLYFEFVVFGFSKLSLRNVVDTSYPNFYFVDRFLRQLLLFK